jgi:flagellar hook-associated protein 3 FlgL
MRVTANTFPNALVDQLAHLSTRQYRLQNQAATGQRMELPADDPTAMRRVLDLQTEAKVVGQYRRNIASLREQAQSAYELMRGLKKALDRARELGIQADGTKSPEQLRLYAIEVTQLIKQAVQAANAKFRGDYLLSGTRSDQPPFLMTLNPDGTVASVTYQGNTTVAESEVGEGITLSAQTIGANTTGSGPRGLVADNRFGADLFNHLISLQNHLLAGDVTAIAATDRPQLTADEDNLLIHFGDNGALQARLEVNDDLAQQRSQSIESLVSQEADADLAQTLVRLTQTQNAYQAALQSGARLLQSSLLDYLR